MSLNNKGFAISGVLYSLLILFVTLFIGILTIFATTKFSLDKVKNDIISKLELKSLKEIVTTSDENPSIPDCIINNTTCVAGTGVAIKVNDSQTYDFYVIKDEGNTLTLIMDRNIDSTTVAWSNSSNSEGPVVALTYLESKTAGWTNITEETYTLSDTYNASQKYTGITRTDARARLLTMTEAEELGCTSISGSCPTWLYGNLDQPPYGYWTSSADASDYDLAWFVYIGGSTNYDLVYNGNNYGVRPVITVSKTVL